MKKILLTFSVIGTFCLYILFHSKETGLCDLTCGDWINQYQNVFLFFPVLFLFSLLVLLMSNNVFVRWWKFARIAIPIIFVISTIINLKLHHSSGGFLNMDDMFDIPAHILMYGIFILGSFIQIWRGYRRS